tara:strand:- start:53 stop:454 length:402 start_codon:yes stop_codon:yes gene_type:complete
MANLSALKAGGVPSTFCGSNTLSAADGDVAITGVGFKPTWIVITGLIDFGGDQVITSRGFKNAGATRSHGKTVYGSGSGTGFYTYENNSRLYMGTNAAGANVEGVLKSFDADGFTVDKTGHAFGIEIFWIVGR